MKRSLGFTLTEIIVVIVILSAILGFGIPNYLKAISKQQAQRAQNNLTALQSLLATYRANTTNNNFPANPLTLTGLNSTLSGNILDDLFAYDYTPDGAGGYTLTATRIGGTENYKIVQSGGTPSGSGCGQVCPGACAFCQNGVCFVGGAINCACSAGQYCYQNNCGDYAWIKSTGASSCFP
ncbi:MAG: type II secretion system protein [Candidatus Omnitrophica bacterium]|nr:type II secretion system protein [Candidatus Omnitrophota bacterium]